MSFGSAGRLTLLAAGALLFVDLFLGWQEVCLRVGAVGRVCASRSGWQGFGIAVGLATTALIVGFAATTLSAPGDSPLYSLRVTIEDLAIPLHRDPEDRAEYLVSLLEQRTSEAARLEATGNALARSSGRSETASPYAAPSRRSAPSSARSRASLPSPWQNGPSSRPVAPGTAIGARG